MTEKLSDVEMSGFRANGQERIPEMSPVQKGGFSKAQGQDLSAGRAALGLWGETDYILSTWDGDRDSMNLKGILETRFLGPWGAYLLLGKGNLLLIG